MPVVPPNNRKTAIEIINKANISMVSSCKCLSVYFIASKTDINFSTIRHGFNMLKRAKELAYIRKKVIQEKNHNDLDNDFFAPKFDDFLVSIEPNNIIEEIHNSFQKLNPSDLKV